MAKKWAAKAWGGIEKGALTKKGWPNIGSVVSYVGSNPGEYGKTMRQLALVANASGDPATKAKAKTAMERLKKSRPAKE